MGDRCNSGIFIHDQVCCVKVTDFNVIYVNVEHAEWEDGARTDRATNRRPSANFNRVFDTKAYCSVEKDRQIGMYRNAIAKQPDLDPDGTTDV